jgi:hypothetical protein
MSKKEKKRKGRTREGREGEREGQREEGREILE